MKCSLIKNKYIIEKNSIDKKTISQIKQELTAIPSGNEGNEDKVSFPIYLETNKELIVPRFYGIKKFGMPKKVQFNTTKCEFQFTGSLRENQKILIEKTVKQLDNIKKGGGILSVGCGCGKTVMGLYLAAKYKMRTLVLVHKSFLQQQWIERAQKFTDAKIGIIRQDKVADDDCDIVVGMIQSINHRDYGDIFDKFGLLIVDEAHHYASTVFSSVFYKVGAEKILGLSATPHRIDGLTNVLTEFMGDIFYKQKLKTNKNVVCKIFRYGATDEKFVEQSAWNIKKKQVGPSHVKMTTSIIGIKSRNTHLVNIINELRKYPERKILVLSSRREHLTLLKKEVDKLIAKDVSDGNIMKDECRTYFYVGGMKEFARKEAEENGDILFGTYDMAHEGLDIERLNTLVLATPKKSITQSIGRIMRRILKKGDLRPVIIDFTDMLSIFIAQGRGREKTYNDGKYQIEEYYLHNDKVIDVKVGLKRDYSLAGHDIDKYLEENPECLYECDLSKILDLQKVNEEDIDMEKIAEIIEGDPNELSGSDDEGDEQVNNANGKQKKKNPHWKQSEWKKADFTEFAFE